MIHYVQGNIFDSEADVIVNPVNLVGVMSKGLALQYKKRYPKMFKLYYKACKNKSFTMGKLMLINEKDHRVLLFPTKIDWRNPSDLEYIKAGLNKFMATYEDLGIKSIAFPKIGCGLGGLDWNDVDLLFKMCFINSPIDVYIYADPTENKLCS